MKSRSGNAATIRTAANISAVCSSDKSVLPAQIVTADAPSFHPMPIFSRSGEGRSIVAAAAMPGELINDQTPLKISTTKVLMPRLKSGFWRNSTRLVPGLFL